MENPPLSEYITNIGRQVRCLAKVAQDDNILDKIREVEFLLDQVLVCDQYVDLLCESIKIKKVELSLLSLKALKCFIESEHVNAKSLQIITETISKIEFKSTESELVEEGYHQAVRCCRAMLKCKHASDLTNGSISEIIIFCFRVVNSKLVKWLRSKAARTLMTITRIVFGRLNQFPDDPCLKPSYQIRLRLGGSSSQSTFKELADQFNTISELSSTTSSSYTTQYSSQPSTTVNSATNSASFQNIATSSSTNSETEATPATTTEAASTVTATTTTTPTSTEANNVDATNLSNSPTVTSPISETITAPAISESSADTSQITSTSSAQLQQQVKQQQTRPQPQPQPPAPLTLRIINERNQPYNLAFINDYFCYLASLINPNHEPDQFAPNKNFDEKMSLGLKLISVAYEQAIDDIGRKSSLLYITKNTICCNLVSILRSPFINPINISHALNLAVDIFIKLRFHLKYQFEAFLERLMEMLAFISENSHNSLASIAGVIEFRSDVLTALLELFRNIDNFPHELYYNYDCDPYSSNIYENLVQICSKNCFQQNSAENNFSPIQLTSLRCLLVNLADIYKVEIASELPPSPYTTSSEFCFQLGILCDRQRFYSETIEKYDHSEVHQKFEESPSFSNPIVGKGNSCVITIGDDIHEEQVHEQRKSKMNIFNELPLILNSSYRLSSSDPAELMDKITARFPKNFEDLKEAKKRKRSLLLAIEKFNARPKDGIQFIKDNKLIDNNHDLVQLLKDNLRVDKKVLGEFLSKEENKSLREAFINSLDFNNLRIDEALRFMLEKFRLPGESQLIERILSSFSEHWFEQNPGILKTSDNALSLAYAIIILNVDQHSKKVKPMTCDEFDRNLTGPGGERHYDRQLLDQIYTNIRNNEIVLPDEQVGLVRQRYLWKCIMVKSDRIDALYWVTGKTDNRFRRSSIQNVDQVSTTSMFNCENQGLLIDTNQILFEIMWSPTVAALAYIFDKIDTSLYSELSKQIVDQGFIRFAHLCAKYGHLDNLVVSLCKFTTDLLSPIPHHNHSGNQRHIMLSDKNSLAALTLLSIIRDYANHMRDSWSNIVRNILHWYCSKCIDDVVQVDDFALQRKLSLRMREIKKSPSTRNQQSSTFLRSVYTYFAGQQPENDDKLQNDAGDSHNCAPSAIGILLQTIQDAEYCQESLIELISALTTTTIDGDPEEVEDAEVFKLEIFTQVILNNKTQASIVWPKIRAYFARQASICGRSNWLGERIISAAFRVAILFEPKTEVFNLLSHIICTLDAEIIRGDHTFLALTSLTELQSTNCITLRAQDLESCFNQVIFPFMDKILDGCDPIQSDRTLNRAVNLLSKIFLKHHKALRSLQTFCKLWVAILDNMGKFIKTNVAMKEAIEELVKNMVLVMANEECLSEELKARTWDRFTWMGIDPMKINH